MHILVNFPYFKPPIMHIVDAIVKNITGNSNISNGSIIGLFPINSDNNIYMAMGPKLELAIASDVNSSILGIFFTPLPSLMVKHLKSLGKR